MRRIVTSSSLGSISSMGRLPSQGNMFFSCRVITVLRWDAALSARNLSNHSRATSSYVHSFLAFSSFCYCLVDLRSIDGSSPLRSSLRASWRSSRASASVTEISFGGSIFDAYRPRRWVNIPCRFTILTAVLINNLDVNAPKGQHEEALGVVSPSNS